jgi:hypothetical protein
VQRALQSAISEQDSLPNEPTEDRLIAVSPGHSVRLTADYHAFLDKAPQRDFVVRTLARSCS